MSVVRQHLLAAASYQHAPHPAAATVHRNGVKPAREIIRLAKHAKVLIGFEKDLLSKVFGIGVIAKFLAGESEYGSLVAIEENTESGIVPRKGFTDSPPRYSRPLSYKTQKKPQSSHEISSG